MATFAADLRDIRFVMFELLKIDELKKFEIYKDFGKEDYDAFIQEAFRFARDVIAPVNEVGDRVGAQFVDGAVILPKEFVEAYKRFKEAGWVGAVQDPAVGGQGLPWVIGQMIDELFIGASVAFSLSCGLSEGVISLLNDFGTPELKARFIPGLIEGRFSGTMCLTEAGAGSDVGASKTMAVKLDNGRYSIQGTKIFITGGDSNLTENVIHMVLARTPDAPSGTKGLSLFVVPKYRVNDDGSLGEFNDVKVGRIEHKMGIKGSPTCVMNFGEDGKCEGYLLGQELEGMKLMFHMMNEARIMVGVQGLALASVAYQTALAYARERIQGQEVTAMKDPKAPRVPIIKHPDVRRMLLWQKAVTEGLRAMLYAIAHYADMARGAKAAGDTATAEKYSGWVELLTPICKAYGSDMGTRCCDLAVQVLGGYGYCQEYPVEQYLRDARIASIYEGTNGIQALDLVGRKLGLKGGSVMMGFLKELAGWATKYKAHPAIGKLVQRLEEGSRVLGELTMKFGSIAAQGDIVYPALNAYAFLECFGDVITAYFLLQEAVIADAELQKLYKEANATTVQQKKALLQDNPEARFYHGKLMAAQFFCNSVLPMVKARAEAIKSGDRSAMEVEF